MNSAIFIKGGSAYGATRLFTDETAAAFRERGFDVRIIDTLSEDLATVLPQVRESRAAFVYTVGGLGDLRDAAGRCLGEIAGAPHVLQMVDYPLSDPRLARFSPRVALLTIDPSHVAAVQAVHGPGRFTYLGFCPHAAVGGLAPEEDEAAFAARSDRPLFAGSFYPPQRPPWLDAEPAVRAVFELAADIAAGPPWTPAVQALETALAQKGHDPASPAAAGVKSRASLIHEHVRRLRRMQFLDAAERVGAPLEICGAGYEQTGGRRSSFTYGGEMDLTTLVQRMRRTRLVFSVNANFGAGSHERPLTAMAAGAAAACDEGLWWDEAFDQAGPLRFGWSDVEGDLSRIMTAGADVSWLAARAADARRLTAAAHLPQHRVDIILAAAAAARLNG
jgi:hypothetical protein